MRKDNQISAVSIFVLIIIVTLLFAGNCFGQIYELKTQMSDCKVRLQLENKYEYPSPFQLEHLLKSIGWGLLAGTGKGNFESVWFYRDSKLFPSHTFLGTWYRENTAGWRGLFGKMITFQKINRNLWLLGSFNMYDNLMIFFGTRQAEGWDKIWRIIAVYIVANIEENVPATFWRDGHKHGNIFWTWKQFELNFDFFYIIK